MLKTMICVCLLWLALLPTDAAAQDRAAIAQDFQVWLAQTIWPKAQASGVDRDTFETAMAGVAINWDLPDLVIPNAPQGGGDTQAEFRPPARYFAPSSVNTATNIGRSLLYPTLEELALALPMPVKEAQKTEVFREEVNMRAGPPPPPDTPACDAATALPLLLAVLSSQPPPCAGIHRAGRSAEIHQEGQSTKPAAIHQRGRSGL